MEAGVLLLGEAAQSFQAVAVDEARDVDVVACLHAIGQSEQLVGGQLLGSDHLAKVSVDWGQEAEVRRQVDERRLRTVDDGAPDEVRLSSCFRGSIRLIGRAGVGSSRLGRGGRER